VFAQLLVLGGPGQSRCNTAQHRKRALAAVGARAMLAANEGFCPHVSDDRGHLRCRWGCWCVVPYRSRVRFS